MNGTIRFSVSIKRAAIVGVLGCLSWLVWFSLHLAGSRIYQVDECGNVFVARLFATGQGHQTIGADLFQLLLSLFSRGASRSADLFSSARFLMFEIFWLNIVLIAVATGEKLASLRGLLALAGAATLAPFWDFGFEARHDNLILTGLLLMWCAMRVQPKGIQSYVLGGAIAVVLQFIAFKSFVYTLPMLAFLILASVEGQNVPPLKRVLGCAIGAGISFAVLGVIYVRVGIWSGFLASEQGTAAVSGGGHRFGAWITLNRFIAQAPLVAALSSAALVGMLIKLKNERGSALASRGWGPEAVLFGIALVGLLVNPTPFQYNLVNLVPFAFLLAFRYGSRLWEQTAISPALVPALLAIILFAHLAPFGSATQRHLAYPNTRQVSLMQRAEDLTDPVKDPVYDAIGMVPTRPIIDPRSFLHSLSLESFTKGPGPQIRDMLAANPAAVLIPNYRTDWLPAADQDFIREHYVSLADDFLVLGKILPPGSTNFVVIHAGRYRISSTRASDLAGTYPEGIQGLFTPEEEGCVKGTIDDVPLSSRPVVLSAGTHRIESSSVEPIAVVWVGPRLDRIHRIGSADHHYLFVNGY